MDAVNDFQREVERAGLIPSEVVPDGRLRRCGTSDKPQGKDGWQVLYSDPLAGAFGNWRTGESRTWSGGGTLDRTARRRIQKDIEKQKQAREQEDAERHKQVAEEARRILEDLPPASPENPYLKAKGVKTCNGLCEDGETLVVPVYDHDGRIMSLQRIKPDGTKRFHPGGKTAGGFFPINKGRSGTLIVCEGPATGLTLHEANPAATVLIAFSGGNLEAVSCMARDRYPDRQIILPGDDDHETEARTGKNPGRLKAQAAARAVGGKVCFPTFQAPEGKSDFNDMHQEQGIEAVKKALEQAKEPDPIEEIASEKPRPIRVLDVRDFLSLELPPRKYILQPIIPTQGLVMLYALRGVGKTMLALHISYAVSTGQPVCRWTAPEPQPVLYLDGEMPGAVMQERLAGVVQSYSIEPAPSFFRIVTPDVQDRTFNLATMEGQALIEPALKNVSLVVVDNLATLARAGRENETESWHPVQDWILSLRRRGISVLLVHHSNKSGGQRGTSSREDVLDTVISLRRPSDYHMEQGARFEVRLDKARGLIGDDAKPFEAMLSTAEGGAVQWVCRDIEDAELEMVLRLKADGATIREIARETRLSKSKVDRLIKKAERGTP